MIYLQRRREKGGACLEIELYSTKNGEEVVADYLNSLPPKDLAKVLRDIELLEEFGTDLHEPYTKHIEGLIWELRSKFSSNCYRIFYFVWSANKLVLLHGFTKKTQKTPVREIETAKKRMNDYQERNV